MGNRLQALVWLLGNRKVFMGARLSFKKNCLLLICTGDLALVFWSSPMGTSGSVAEVNNLALVLSC